MGAEFIHHSVFQDKQKRGGDAAQEEQSGHGGYYLRAGYKRERDLEPMEDDENSPGRHKRETDNNDIDVWSNMSIKVFRGEEKTYKY